MTCSSSVSSSSSCSSRPSLSSAASLSSTHSKTKTQSQPESSYHKFLGVDLRTLREQKNSNRMPFGLLFEVNPDLKSSSADEFDSGALKLDSDNSSSSKSSGKKSPSPYEQPPRKRQRTNKQAGKRSNREAVQVQNYWEIYHPKEEPMISVEDLFHDPTTPVTERTENFVIEVDEDEEDDREESEEKENTVLGNTSLDWSTSISPSTENIDTEQD